MKWTLPDGSWVKEGDVVARFSAEQSKLQLADALFDLQRNTLARAAKQDELGDAQGHLAVDLSQVAGQLGIAHRYAHATEEALARNAILDAVQDEHFLGVKQDTLTWRKNSSSTRGKAELALIDAQRATNEVVAKERRGDLDALEIHAPHAGLLVLEADWTGEKPRIGASMWAGNNFASLPDIAQMEVDISIAQAEAQAIKDGAVVELAPLGAPEQKITLENFLGRRRSGASQPRIAGEISVDEGAGVGRCGESLSLGAGTTFCGTHHPAADRANADRAEYRDRQQRRHRLRHRAQRRSRTKNAACIWACADPAAHRCWMGSNRARKSC